LIELHLKKKTTGTRAMVEIIVVRPPRPGESRAQREERAKKCKRVCTELRAYLMIGR
jgi:hypothetical protein